MYQCNFCTFYSKYYDLLLQHYLLEHEHAPHFFLKCGINGCLQQYSKVMSFRKHIERNHPGFVSCIRQKASTNDVNDLEIKMEEIPVESKGNSSDKYDIIVEG